MIRGIARLEQQPTSDAQLAIMRSTVKDGAADRPGIEILDDRDLVHYAHTLYSRLRDADDRDVETVIAVMPPAVGIGHAIRDRLTQAASQRR